MDRQVLSVCGRIMTEVSDSILKHGDWSDYSMDQMGKALYGELLELGDAEARKDVIGHHGMVREAIQASACLVKMIIQLEGRNVEL